MTTKPTPEELAERSKSIYAGIDALTPQQRVELIDRAAHAVTGGIEKIAEHYHEVLPPEVIAAFMQLTGLVSIVGYTNALDADDDSEFDASPVSAVLADFGEASQDILARALGISREEQDEANKIGDRVRARVEAGEDEQSALVAEIAASNLAPDVKAKTLAFAKGEHQKNDDQGYGMYL